MQGKIRTVLCVDDQATDRQLVCDLFQNHNFKVLTAENWPDAKVLLNSNDIDLVILDYRLVQSNAVDIAIEIRKCRPRVPIMLLSGFLADIPEYFKRAVDTCVSKSSPLHQWVEAGNDLCAGGEGNSSGSQARAV